MKMTGGTWVEVHWPGAQQPARMQLLGVKQAVQTGRLPQEAVARTGPNEPWRPASDVVAECPDLRPTRTWWVASVVAVGPLAVLFVHGALFGWAGILGPVALVMIGGIAAGVLLLVAPLRTTESRVIFAKPLFLAAVALATVVTEGPGVALGLVDRAAHERIEVALTSSNPCDVEKVSNDLDAHGNVQQRAAAPGAWNRCADQRAAALCDRLAKQVDLGKLEPSDEAAERASTAARATATVDTLERIVTGKLEQRDLSATDNYSCPQTFHALAKAVASSTQVWANATTVSDEMTKELKSIGLSADAKLTLAGRADDLAKAAVGKKTTGELDESKGVCALAKSLGAETAETRPSCELLDKRYASLSAAEKSARDAKDAADRRVQDAHDKAAAANDARCDALETARNTCFSNKCLELAPDDPRADACEDRCERVYPKTGCE